MNSLVVALNARASVDGVTPSSSACCCVVGPGSAEPARPRRTLPTKLSPLTTTCAASSRTRQGGQFVGPSQTSGESVSRSPASESESSWSKPRQRSTLTRKRSLLGPAQDASDRSAEHLLLVGLRKLVDL